MPARLHLAPRPLALLCALALLTGCRHHTHTSYVAPPTIAAHHASASRASTTHAAARPAPPPAPVPRELPGRPTHVEVGMASWYGPNYNHRHAADGSVYDQDAMTAAHRTLPLGSLVRVTNLTTNETVVARITDRGPFVHGRVIDLSEGAAKAIGLYRMGVAKVRVEAMPTPTASPTGSWCVQTGAFATERDAIDLKSALLQRYRGSRVQEFQGPTGFWVRIDPAGHDRTQAAAIQDWIGRPDDHAEAYLVRVD
jgi:rare lipoprotein A